MNTFTAWDALLVVFLVAVVWKMVELLMVEKHIKNKLSKHEDHLQVLEIELDTLQKANVERNSIMTEQLRNMSTQLNAIKTDFQKEIKLLEIEPIFNSCDAVIATYYRVWQKL
jgi:uncharacterized protein YsxB (DUF464 family)